MALVQGVPNSRTRLKEGRLVCGLAEERIQVDVIFPEALNENNEQVAQLRIELKSLKLGDLVQRRIQRPSYLVWPSVCQCIKDVSESRNPCGEGNSSSR